MVSVLGFMRRVPLSTRPEMPRSPGTTPRETWGIEVTVSVSTIMLRTDPSAGFPRAPLNEVVERFAKRESDLLVPVDTQRRVSSMRSELLFPPLSLPLSTLVLCLDAFGVVSSSIFCSFGSSDRGWFRMVSADGVEGSLVISSTVSRAEPGALMRLLTLRGALRSPLVARSSDGGKDRLLEVFGGVEPHNGMLLDLSGLGTLEDDSTFGEALSTRGLLLGWESALCTALAVGTGMDRCGLRS